MAFLRSHPSLHSSCRSTPSSKCITLHHSRRAKTPTSVSLPSQPPAFLLNRVRHVECLSSDTLVAEATTSGHERSTVPTSNVWELDFCSRPLLDERGKKVWELLICDAERNFEYAEYFPNSKINSAELKAAISKILEQPEAVKPDKIRFFRGQMQTIITKSLTELGIKAVPSRRCFSVMSWLEDRLENVYKTDPRYDAKATSLFQMDLGSPEPLPDALRGEKWAFVQLPLGDLLDMLKRVDRAEIFGSAFDLHIAHAETLPRNILVPGVAVFSRRALPLAAWTNGLEIASVKADVERASLVLETGVSQRWKYGAWRPTPDSLDEARGWEEAKQGMKGLHFLAVQPDPDSEELNGLWLLLDREVPKI